MKSGKLKSRKALRLYPSWESQSIATLSFVGVAEHCDFILRGSRKALRLYHYRATTMRSLCIWPWLIT